MPCPVLLVQQSDNNVKLIILDRLDEVKQRHPSIMQSLVMDMLQALSSPNMDIRRKCLDVALSLVTKKNIDEVVQILKKEVMKTQGKDMEKGGEYRQVRYPCSGPAVYMTLNTVRCWCAGSISVRSSSRMWPTMWCTS